jgi:hypothetical protein
MMLSKSIVRGSVLTLAVVFVAGCGGGDKGPQVEKQKTVPVTGILTYKGKPVGDASVALFSLDGKIAPFGKTDAAGTFILSTYGSQDGAPPGKYKVTVAVSGVKEIEPGVLADEPSGGFKSPIPVKYANSQTTDIPVVEVKETGKNEIVIDLK